MTGPRVPLAVALAVGVMLVATAVVMSAHSVALAADGPWFLVRILDTGQVYSYDARLFGNAVRQVPVLLAARAGLTDTYLLTVLLGVGQLVLPAFVWSVATLLTRPSLLVFTAVSMSAGLSAGSMWFLGVNESVIAVPLTVLVGVLLWQPQAWRLQHVVLAAAAALVLVASYESALPSGVVLTAWAGWRAAEASSALERYGSALVALLSAVSVVVAIFGAATGPGPTSSRSSLYYVVSGQPGPLYVAFLGVAVAIATLIPRTLASGVRWTIFGLGGACATVAVFLLPATPVAGFQARGATSLIVLPLLGLLWWRWRVERASTESRPLRGPASAAGVSSRWFVYVVALAFVGAATLSNIQGLRPWSRNLEAFQTAVNASPGFRWVDEALLPRDRRLVVWGWTSTSLSLVLRRGPTDGVLVDRDPSYVPFPPNAARRQLPDRYVWRR